MEKTASGAVSRDSGSDALARLNGKIARQFYNAKTRRAVLARSARTPRPKVKIRSDFLPAALKLRNPFLCEDFFRWKAEQVLLGRFLRGEGA